MQLQCVYFLPAHWLSLLLLEPEPASTQAEQAKSGPSAATQKAGLTPQGSVRMQSEGMGRR